LGPRITRRAVLRASAAGLGALCARAAVPASAVPERGLLRLAHALEWGEKESLDPASPTRMFPCVDLLYDGLVRRNEKRAPIPALATKWECDPSATRWTFHLRPGVKFHNGQSLTSRDVVATLRHITDPALGSPAATTLSLIDVAHLAAPDPLTVVIPLKQPHADFPVLMLHYACCILPDGTKAGIGTGPFQMDTFAPDGTTVLTAFDGHWDGKPGVARIEVTGIADQEARLNAFLAEQVDFLGTVSAAAADTVRSDPRFSVQEFPTGTWVGITMQTNQAPFDKVAVRQALKLVADRPALVKAVLAGHGQVAADQPVWPEDAYAGAITPKRDLARARGLLKEAGFPSGLDVVLHTAGVYDGLVPLAVAYKEMAAEAGIRVEVRQVAGDSYWSNTWRKVPLFCSWWGERPADQVLNELYRPGATWNETVFDDAEFNRALDSARRELNFEKRRTHYQKAQTILAERGGSLIPFFKNEVRAVNRRIAGIEPNRSLFQWNQVSVRS
jgi:peptide/nickel transport system substrate-binding protein